MRAPAAARGWSPERIRRISPDATDWLAPGDLLMSNGLNLPEQAKGQVSSLHELDSGGLSGLAPRGDMHAPPLAPEFPEQADRLEFPVLAIPRDVPFVAVSKVVATANFPNAAGTISGLRHDTTPGQILTAAYEGAVASPVDALDSSPGSAQG